MTIEHACTQVVRKPWGSSDLRPWSNIHHDGAAIGELWFQRTDANAADPALLLKLLFATGPLSIQVHPDDASAQSLGLRHGKSEAWYILSAAPGAEVAIGLTRELTPSQLRTAIEDGLIEGLVRWLHVRKGDAIFVPAGTIHAIGAGIVIAEIQQRSDATFRLFDHDRGRELHVDSAVSVANAGPAGHQTPPRYLTDARKLLVASPHFVLEQIDLRPKSNWELRADFETWVLVLEGHAQIGPIKAFIGEAIFLEADHTSINVGSDGLKGLMAYVAAEPCSGLLHNLDGPAAAFPIPDLPRSPFHDRAGEARP